jgi:2-polyprenyl-6-methoxyphenol hydroxylase-like FAD-dependent oxidoreductase
MKLTLLELLKQAESTWGGMLKELMQKTTVVKFYPIYRIPLNDK